MTPKKTLKETPKEASKETVDEIEAEIRRHNRLYFEENRPEISDAKFDRLVERLRKLRPGSPLLSEIPSDVVKEFRKVRHLKPMLSLDKCYKDEDLLDWAGKFEGDVVVTPKIDGCATELRYNARGELELAATRGDGAEGEEITPNARRIPDIPQKIPRGPLEIRGEIYMRLSVFKKYEGEFANPRNLAAGAIKQKDPKKTGDYRLSFFGYDVLGEGLKTEREKFERLRSIRIPTVEMRLVTKEAGALKSAYDYFLKKRDSWDFETDGVVFRANRVDEQERLGATAHHPRYAIAYKFQGDSGTTVLKEVEWSVARTGVITPVGIVEPVELSGATVTRVSLHNYKMMREMGLRRGSRVVMMRRGGVIPNLESVVDTGRGALMEPPARCPSCDSPTEIRDDFLYCTNEEGCRKTKMEELEHFLKTIECDGFGEKLVAQLYGAGFVRDPADFYRLKKEDLLELERMGEVLAAKLIGNIQARRELPLDLFLRSLGIRELARHTSKILVREFKTLDRILKVSEEELSAIHSIGPVIAREVVEGLKKKRPLIERLNRFVEIKPARGPAGPMSAGPLAGKKFCFTGSLTSMERGDAQRLVEEKGGEIAETVTQDLDYLIVGDGGGAGSKLAKAKALQAKGGKVKVIPESEWKKLIGSLS